MNYSDPILREIVRFSPLDVMLADIAVRIQLTPTDYQRAIDHYNAVHEWLEREESPLFGLVEDFYTQGGFAIGATVARHATDDEFDIDVMAQLALRADADPEAVLALLHGAICAEPGSRYHGKADRKTRCSTVNYSGMHLDVTPAVRLVGHEPKTSFIFHSKRADKQTLFANPHGFALWFIAATPPDEAFARFFEKRSLDYDVACMKFMAKADAVPVPAQMPAYRKSRAVIALQLIKRWRNLAYDRRHKTLKRPPSVLVSYYVGQHANSTDTLTAELIHQVESMIVVLEQAQRLGRTVYAENPRCAEDELTDRWPCDLAEQRVFVDELRAFAVQLHRLAKGLPLPEMQRVLEELFGERAAADAVRAYTGQHVRDDAAGRSLHIPRKGSMPALGSTVAAAPLVRQTPKHNFYGD
ncbi:MAG: nucleotidyltransferase [Methyloceanibacter sp.]|nr:MAG: nucleotidyltransferase [Methyloceanibacter sp.]